MIRKIDIKSLKSNIILDWQYTLSILSLNSSFHIIKSQFFIVFSFHFSFNIFKSYFPIKLPFCFPFHIFKPHLSIRQVRALIRGLNLIWGIFGVNLQFIPSAIFHCFQIQFGFLQCFHCWMMKSWLCRPR